MSEQRQERLEAAQKALQAGDFARGLSLAEDVLAADANDGEARYMAAVAARYLKQYDRAASHLRELHAANPEYGRAWQESAHLARAQGRGEEARAAYARAVSYTHLTLPTIYSV